jgi:hypothetical protein
MFEYQKSHNLQIQTNITQMILDFPRAPFDQQLALSLNLNKFNNSVDILELDRNYFYYNRKMGLTSRCCGLVGCNRIADHLPGSENIKGP